MAIMKTENGIEFPAEAYLVVPDPEAPSTWKLRIWESPEEKVTVRQLGRAAAALGPGFRGNRVDLPPDERRQAARKLIRLYREQGVPDEDIPPYLFEIAGLRAPMSEADYIERDAMLFEAGDYPDKGVRVGEEDLQKLAQTPGDIPIYVEHARSPIRLGSVTSLFVRGKQLWGRLRLLKEADALLDRLGVRSLSISVPRTLDRILEVSVTGSPRVAGARMFHAEDGVIAFALGETPKEEGKEMEEKAQYFATEIQELQQRLAEEQEKRQAIEAAFHQLEERYRQMDLQREEQELKRLVEQGKMPPKFIGPMLAFYAGAQKVEFSGREMAPYEALKLAFSESPAITEAISGKAGGNGSLYEGLRQLGFSEDVAKVAAQIKEEG